MKQSPLKKESKSDIRKLIKKTDKSLQDFYRTKNLRCEVCGIQMYCMHHFVEKSQSTRLRYDEINLVPICKGCHFRHHTTGDAMIRATIILKRGQAWLKKIMKLKQETVQITKQYLDEQSKKFK